MSDVRKGDFGGLNNTSVGAIYPLHVAAISKEGGDLDWYVWNTHTGERLSPYYDNAGDAHDEAERLFAKLFGECVTL